MNLRPYQVKFIQDIREALRKFKRIVCCAATGSGKSKTFISISRGAIDHKRTVLIISESTSIYGQIHKEIGDTVNIGDGVKEFFVEPNKIYVAMCQTLVKRPGLIEQLKSFGDKLIIISDEAHVGTATKLLKQFDEAYILGFTASPDFRRAKHLPEIYESIVIGPQPQELVEQGFLAPYHHYERKVVDLSGLVKSSTGDFTEESQEKAFQKKEVFEGIVEDLRLFTFYKCMIFCASIKHCMETVEMLRVLNYDVSECHSKNPNTEKDLFEFTHGSNNICVSVASLTKGFDFPPTDLIILNRATDSLPVYLQICGRGSRPLPGKLRFNVIDYGGNGTRHKPWNYEHDWSNLWNAKPKKEGAAPIKICKNCGYMMAVKTNPCPECGEITIVAPTEAEVKETQLVEITAKYNTLRGRNISTLTPPELVDYVKMTNKTQFGTRIARAKGAEYLSRYAELQKWKYGWWKHIIADEKLNYADIVIK